ncbi:MAG: DUF4422 domain-containing protein, partial [Lachnospiraceae bacterium]|nr:DUF4422 domain-containing protein [Lachnospiraceae bacterium]
LLGGDDVVNIALAGYTRDGKPGVNDLSYAFMDAVEMINAPGPNLSARLYRDIPDDFLRDDAGDSISARNPNFCELTVLYWGWKNLTCDYLGLAHYRRHFGNGTLGADRFDSVLNREQTEELLREHSIIVPKKRRYFIETIYSHYKHTHYADQLDKTREIISEFCPAYLSSFDRIMRRRSAYMFNMMIMRRDLLDAYCGWVFSILFRLEKVVDVDGLSAYQGRFFGRVSEILFNVWLEQQAAEGVLDKKDIAEVPCIHMEKINWPGKISAFLSAKFFGKKYEGSF